MSRRGIVVFALAPHRGAPLWAVLLADLLRRNEVEVAGWVAVGGRREAIPARLQTRVERAVFGTPGLTGRVSADRLGGAQLDSPPPTCTDVLCIDGVPDASGAAIWAFGTPERPLDPGGIRRVGVGAVHSCLWRLDGEPRAVEHLWTRSDPRSGLRSEEEAVVRWARLGARAISGGPCPMPMSIASAPAGALARALGRAKQMVRRRRPQWWVAYQLGGEAPERGRLTHLVPPSDRLWADPFPVEHAGERAIFLEEAIHGERGRILCVRVVDESRFEPIGVVLEAEHHLSYPQVVAHGGELWMVPEASESGRLVAYRCVRFPDRWDPHGRVLLEHAVGDPTLWRGRDRWWMWATLVDGGNPSDALLLYSSPAFDGPWTPHPDNPVRVDVRRSRPAGRPWQDAHGRLCRVAQDCAPDYGSALVVQEVQSMVPYRDHDRRRIVGADFGVERVHTLNRWGKLWALDLMGVPPPGGS